MESSKLGGFSLSDVIGPDDALASVKPISLGELDVLASMRDPQRRLSVLVRIKTWDRANNISSVAQLRHLIAVEDQIETVIRSDKNWYFSNSDAPPQTQFAIDLVRYHTLSAEAYQRLIAHRDEWSEDTDLLLQSAVMFAIYHYGSAIKWGYLHHSAAPADMWLALHQLYRLAEVENFANSESILFNPDAGINTTAAALYIRALLLETLNTGGLSIPQVEIADSWLTEWSHHYALDRVCDPQLHILQVSLDAATGLVRLVAESANDDTRYLRLSDFATQISQVQAHLIEGRPYQGRNSVMAFAVAEYAALLGKFEQLHKMLLQPKTALIETRTDASNQEAKVCVGYQNVQQTLHRESGVNAGASADQAVMFDVSTGGLTLGMRIKDMSSKGMGLIVESGSGEKLAIGEILLVKPDGEQSYRLATIVRKLATEHKAEMLLGVEVLSLQPLPIRLHCLDEHNAQNSTTIAAVFAPGAEADGRQDMLVLNSSDFVPRQPYAVNIQNVLYAIRVSRVARNFSGWVGLRFEVTAKR